MTYAELKNLIQNYLQNSETSFTTYLPDMIKQAEDRILENVQLPVFRKNQTGSLSSGNEYLGIPSDFLAPYSLSYTSSSNQTFLMNKDGNWQISPAYDICFSYRKGGTWTNVHQSSINGKYDNFTKDGLLDFAKKFGIKKANVILEEVVSAVNQWSKIAVEIDIPKEKIQYINKYLRIKDF